jgi:hypothetical protein
MSTPEVFSEITLPMNFDRQVAVPVPLGTFDNRPPRVPSQRIVHGPRAPGLDKHECQVVDSWLVKSEQRILSLALAAISQLNFWKRSSFRSEPFNLSLNPNQP